MTDSRTRICIVEDDPAVLAQFLALFQRSGYEARGFSNPRDFATISFDASSPTVIVSDMRMPELSGLDLMKILRARGVFVPIVFVSGESTHEEIVAAHEDLSVSYVLKPVLPKKLLFAVESAVVRDAVRRRGESKERRVQQLNEQLTPTQKIIFSRLLKSMSNQEIAAELGMSAEAVKKHRQAVFAKCGCESIFGLLRLVEAGSVEGESPIPNGDRN